MGSSATWSIGNRTTGSSSDAVRNARPVAGRALPGARCLPAPSRGATSRDSRHPRKRSPARPIPIRRHREDPKGGRYLNLGRATVPRGHWHLVDVTNLPSRQDVRPADPLNPKPLPRVRCTLGVAADLMAENRGQLDRDIDAGLNPFAPQRPRFSPTCWASSTRPPRTPPESDQ